MTSKYFAAIYLADPVRATALGELFAEQGIDFQVTANSEELYHTLNYRPVDVVILENDLKGFLSGIDIVDRVFQDLLRPTTILLAKPTSDLKKRAAEIGIDLVLPEQTEPELIRSAVTRLLAEERVAQVLIPGEARKLVQSFDSIRPLPQVILKLATYLEQEEIDQRALAEDITVDTRITADLLKLANSSAIGLQRKVSNAFDAINYLGSRRTIALLLSNGFMQTQHGLGMALPTAERIWFNNRSVLIASTASLFAERFEQISHPTANVLGLLQDLGILVMAHAFGNRYLQIIRRFRTIGQLRLEIMEKQDFGFQHQHVSAAILQKWGLPASMIKLVLHHHDTDGNTERSQTEKRFLHVMGIGEAFANLTDGHVAQRYGWLKQRLDLYGEAASEQAKQCLAESIAKAVEARQIFSLPAPDDRQIRALVKQIQTGDPKLEDIIPIETVIEEEEELTPSVTSTAEPQQRLVATATATTSAPPQPSKVVKVPSAPATKPNKAKRILLIDDEPLLLDLIAYYLERADLQPVKCASWKEALPHFASVSAVLLDIHLEADSGIEITKRLRAKKYKQPIIILSGDRTRDTVGQCLLAGATDYLTKPADETMLLAKIAKHTGLNLQPSA